MPLAPALTQLRFSANMEDINTNQIWKDILEVLKISVSPAIFSTWFSQTHLSEVKKINDRYSVEVGCASSYVKSTIEARYYGLIQDTISKTLTLPCDLVFTIKELPKQDKMTQDATPLFEPRNAGFDIREQLIKAKLRLGLNFNNYAVSTSNQMAWAAADAVSKMPGNAYNPLFIWGGVGVGKTHLMNAVGYSVLENEASAEVLCVTGEEFTNDIVEGIRNKTTPSVRNKYRKLKVLMVDDIQFIAGKEAVQQEFFHTFNALVGQGAQILMTSDRPPGEIAKLEERLRSRFEAGLIVDISPPDFELRCAIAQIKAAEKKLDIPTTIIHLIAGNIDSARKIEGFLVTLTTEVVLKKTEITEELVSSLLGKGPKEDNKIKSNPNDVVAAVSKYFQVGKRQLLGISRARPITIPRQILMYILRIELSLPLVEVGRVVGGRDHTTVMHAVEKVTRMASENVQTREDLMGIKKMI